MNRESKEIYLQVEGMHCAACVNSIEKGLSKLDGVNSCRVNLAMGTAVISIDDNKINTEKIGQEIEQLGFSATESQPDFLAHSLKEINTAKSNFFLSLLFAVPLMVIAMTPMFASVYLFSETVDILAQAILSGLLIILPGRSIIFDALKQAIHFRANMNTLIAIGTLSAFFWSLYQLIVYQIDITDKIFFESSGMIICLILLGRFLEAKAKGKAGEAIGSLLNLMPSSTTAIINDVEVAIDPSTAQPGMILIVKPGERIPTDGKIIEGNPTIDESMLTGESIPVDKRKGDQVLSGSLNGNISFRLEVTVPSDKSYLAGIIRLVSEAQSRKAPVQLLADKIASIFVPIVIGIALVTLALWYAFDPSSPMLMKSVISVLIISCPCALGLATPTAVLTGTGRAAKEGVLIKGGDVLEKINDIDTIVFDKTGTLTYGDLEVTEIHSFGQYSENHLLRIIGSLEMQSEHPIAEAIVRQMKATQLEPTKVRNSTALPGFGMKGEIDNRTILVGNSVLMENEGVALGQSKRIGNQEMDKGRTIVYVALDEQVIGMISLADRVRGEAPEVIKELKDNNLHISMLTGDNFKTAEGLSSLLNIDSFEAEIRPEQKKLIVESLRRVGNMVAMVGDGINDAPALAEANIAVAIGSGTDVAIEVADVVLSKSDLNSIRKMFQISKISKKVIRQNLFWAFFYNILAIPLAAGLFYPFFGISLTPMIAAITMSFSSVLVVLNSLRLKNVPLR